MKLILTILMIVTGSVVAQAKVDDLGLLIKQNKVAAKKLEKELHVQLRKGDKLAMRTRPDSRTIRPDAQNSFYVPSTNLVFEKDLHQNRPSRKAIEARLTEELDQSGE